MADIMPLDKRMKSYESEQQHFLDERPTLVRLDGHAFSKYTATFDQPYDERFHCCMVETAKDILRAHHDCSTVYTQSDEMTLVFPRGLQKFNARTDKYISLLSSLASVRFNHHLSNQPNIPVYKIGVAIFDARVFQVPTMNEALNAILWRSRSDNTRNSVSKYARQSFSAKQIFKKSTAEQLKMMEEIGIKYEEVAPLWVQRGSTIKKEEFVLECIDIKSEEKTFCNRTRVSVREIAYTRFTPELVHLLESKHWPAEISVT